MSEVNMTIRANTPEGFEVILYPKTTPEQAGSYPNQDGLMLLARIKELEEIVTHMPVTSPAAWLGYGALGIIYLT